MAKTPTPLAWLIVAEHGGEESPEMHAGMAVGIVKAVTAPWSLAEVGYSFMPGESFVRTGIVVLRLTDGHAGRLLAGAMRVRSRFLPRVGWEAVRASALPIRGVEAVEFAPPAVARATSKISGQVMGMIARASAGLEQRRFRPAA